MQLVRLHLDEREGRQVAVDRIGEHEVVAAAISGFGGRPGAEQHVVAFLHRLRHMGMAMDGQVRFGLDQGRLQRTASMQGGIQVARDVGYA